jgi:Arc/MetJ-type ribon-helix-helix transcriptional regulator
MRPQIPDTLVSRADEVTDVGGYSSVGELVRDSVRRRVEQLEAAKLQEDLFPTAQHSMHVRRTEDGVRFKRRDE